MSFSRRNPPISAESKAAAEGKAWLVELNRAARILRAQELLRFVALRISKHAAVSRAEGHLRRDKIALYRQLGASINAPSSPFQNLR